MTEIEGCHFDGLGLLVAVKLVSNLHLLISTTGGSLGKTWSRSSELVEKSPLHYQDHCIVQIPFPG